MKNILSKKWIRPILVILVCFLDIAFSAFYIYWIKNRDIAIPVSEASSHIGEIFIQNMISVGYPIILLIGMYCILKKNFSKELYLRIETKRQRICIILLLAVLVGILSTLLIIKTDRITVIYALFYYVVIIAFWEEIVIRGVCVYLVKDYSTIFRYLIPNVAFAFMHIFSYSSWGALSTEYVMNFVANDVLGLVFAGCIFQFLKEKTGTIWIPVLVHGILDYTSVFTF